VVVAGRWLARRSRLWLAQALQRVTLTPSMESLFLTATYYSVWILTLMVALIILGVPATAVVAVAGVVLVLLGVFGTLISAAFVLSIVLLMLGFEVPGTMDV
jgi:small-conductance mechanosensitive channel